MDLSMCRICNSDGPVLQIETSMVKNENHAQQHFVVHMKLKMI